MARLEFVDNPQLDLHPFMHAAGGDVEGALAAVRLFLVEQLAAATPTVEIVHGKGLGRLRARVHTVLDDYKAMGVVTGYELRGKNTGSTIVYLPTAKTQRAPAVATPLSPLSQKPFAALRDQLIGLLDKPAPAPIPTPDPEPPSADRIARQQMEELETLARQLVAERRAASAPPAPSRAPRRLPAKAPPTDPAGLSAESRRDQVAEAREGPQAQPQGRPKRDR